MFIFHIIGLGTTWVIWLWLINQNLNFTIGMTIAVGCTLISIPVIYMGRWILDQQPTPDRAIWVTTTIHYLIAVLIGSSVIEATKIAKSTKNWPFEAPYWLGILMMVIGGVLLLLVVFTLALKGLGAPMAISLTRVVATEWIYAWTRNPMVLSGLAFLVGLGLWLKSSLFLVWMLAVLSPALLVYLIVYEERELEIRFGDSYLQYKSMTPMLWPKRPSQEET